MTSFNDTGVLRAAGPETRDVHRILAFALIFPQSASGAAQKAEAYP
jgi:hypothetical protein